MKRDVGIRFSARSGAGPELRGMARQFQDGKVLADSGLSHFAVRLHDFTSKI
jgi:hypothetical protein